MADTRHVGTATDYDAGIAQRTPSAACKPGVPASAGCRTETITGGQRHCSLTRYTILPFGQQASAMAGRHYAAASGCHRQCCQQCLARLFRTSAPLHRQRHPFGGRRTTASGVRQTDAGSRTPGAYGVRQDDQRL